MFMNEYFELGTISLHFLQINYISVCFFVFSQISFTNCNLVAS